MNIKPCYDNVLIEHYEYTPKNESNIYIQNDDDATSVEAFAKVLDVKENEQGIKPGDVILVDKNVGFNFNIDRKKYRIILLTQVIAVVSGITEETEVIES